MNEQLQEARATYIGRLFSLGGGIIFIIGTVISVVVAYRAYTRLLQQSQ
ncbi:hypothetical protein [Bacillus clarus]|uniref:Uncharacterized protein n=1 Tax=Bacillus clarus TaxID=2338372 RepID=A0A090YL22_9BACI|nr:hypothetical protein [Bacillus clarus]KFM98931.1 hypothetical protein DJ93_3900 [Bacillus clarus]